MTASAARYDAIVVGARVAGAATAALLAGAGQRVLVVERGRYGTDTLSTHALVRSAVVQLERWGLLDCIVAAGTPAIRLVTYQFDRGTLPLPVKPEHGVDALYAPRRTVLDPILVDSACEAGAEVQYGVTVTDVERDDTGRVMGIRGRDRAGATFRAEAPIVIGADGLRSVVAERVAAPIEHQMTAASSFLYGYWADAPVDGYIWAFRSAGVAGAIPTNDGETCLFVSTTPSGVERDRPAVFAATVERISPELGALARQGTLVGPVRGFTGPPGYLRRAYGPGWALVGDAGYWKDPVSAHGLTDALRDAELLARAVLAARGGEMSEADAFGQYQATRDRLSRPVLEASDVLAAQRWTGAEVGGLLKVLSDAIAAEADVLAALPDIRLAGVGC